MTELRFQTDLYAVEAIDRTVAVYKSFATIERESSGDLVILRVTAPDGVDEAELAGEIANYVLGVMVDQRMGMELRS